MMMNETHGGGLFYFTAEDWPILSRRFSFKRLIRDPALAVDYRT